MVLLKELVTERPWFAPACRPLSEEVMTAYLQTDAATGSEILGSACGPRGCIILKCATRFIFASFPLPQGLHINLLEFLTWSTAMILRRILYPTGRRVFGHGDNTTAIAWGKKLWNRREEVDRWLAACEDPRATVSMAYRRSDAMLADIGTRCRHQSTGAETQSPCSPFVTAVRPACRKHRFVCPLATAWIYAVSRALTGAPDEQVHWRRRASELGGWFEQRAWPSSGTRGGDPQWLAEEIAGHIIGRT